MSSYTQADLDRLEGMIASGVLESEYEGRRIKYRSMTELVRARDTVRQAVEGSGGARQRVTHVYPAFGKGT